MSGQERASKGTMSRRRALQVGSGVLVAAAGGLVWRASERGVFATGTGPAYEAWKDWRAAPKGPMRLVAAAILAANPHNSQPWLFRVTKDQIELLADQRRHIGMMDPLHREMHIGLGCALENMEQVAFLDGWQTTSILTPDPKEPNLMARIKLTKGTPKESLLAMAIPLRRTDRGAFDTKQEVSPKQRKRLGALAVSSDVQVRWFTSPADKQLVGAWTVRGTEAIIKDREQSRDSHKWLRGSWQELEQKKDGLTYDVQGMSTAMNVMAKMLPPVSGPQGDRFWLEATKTRQVGTASAFGMLLVRQPSATKARLLVGRTWQRMHLWATTQGLSMHPLNQWNERIDIEQHKGLTPTFTKGMKELLADGEWHSIMTFRVGYPTRSLNYSPRRPVKEVLVS